MTDQRDWKRVMGRSREGWDNGKTKGGKRG